MSEGDLKAISKLICSSHTEAERAKRQEHVASLAGKAGDPSGLVE